MSPLEKLPLKNHHLFNENLNLTYWHFKIPQNEKREKKLWQFIRVSWIDRTKKKITRQNYWKSIANKCKVLLQTGNSQSFNKSKYSRSRIAKGLNSNKDFSKWTKTTFSQLDFENLPLEEKFKPSSRWPIQKNLRHPREEKRDIRNSKI